MPNIVLDLEVNRVDLVDEGANSEAFIKLYKRKEMTMDMSFEEILAKMKPEHVEVITAALDKAKTEVVAELSTANEALTNELNVLKAKTEVVAELSTANEALTNELNVLKAKTTGITPPSTKDESSTEDDDVMKSLDPIVQEVFKSIKAQRDAAEEVVKQLNTQKVHDEAVQKAKELKAIPVDEAKLVEVMKSITPELHEVLKAANAAITNGVLLEEVGTSKGDENGSDAWTKIEKRAKEMATADGITVQKAIAKTIKENPELYREYLNGGVV